METRPLDFYWTANGNPQVWNDISWKENYLAKSKLNVM